MKKMKPSVKAALASTLVITSTAAIAYANSDNIGNKNSDNENKLELAVEKIDSDTVKVSIDNIKEVPKSLQFSIKLDGAELNDENSIRDLVAEESEERLRNNEYATNSNNILTDYTYNRDENTINVLITAENSIPKIGNKIDVFELDLKSKGLSVFAQGEAPTYKILPNENIEYKYVSNTNKEYTSQGVEYSGESITMNTAPTIIIKDDIKYIEIVEGESLQLTAENLGVEMQDADGDELKLEVKNGNEVIQDFTPNKPGIYNLSVTAVDIYGERSETLTIQVNVLKDNVTEKPTITRDNKELENITINAGDIFEPMKDVTAVDAKGNTVEVELKVDKELNLDPEIDTEYNLTYTAKDIYDNIAEVTITLTVKANKAPMISGVKDYNLTVGDKFDPEDGVTVTDEDKDIKLKIDSNVNMNIPGEYRVLYSATDSGNKTTRVQSKVIVNPKLSSINSIPVINAEDRTILVGTEFNPLDGVTATDKEDNDLTDAITWEGEVKINEPGKYSVKYFVKDSQGAIGTKTITVTVEPKMEEMNSIPVIVAYDKVIKLGETFDALKGVTATDKEDKDLTSKITYESDVNVDQEGEYTVIYTVVDSKGAKATKTIKVTVKKDIVLAESITINNKFDKLYTGSEKILKATINEEAEIKYIDWTTSDENIASIEAIGNDVKVVAKSEGKVTITAKTTDGSNKSDSVTINVVDFKNESTIPSFVKDIVDNTVVKPVAGTGEKNSVLELEVQDVTIEKFENFLKELEKLDANLEEKYEDGNFTVYKIKLTKKARLFRSGAEGYIEIRIDNNLANAKEYKASIYGILGTVQTPENPGNPETPETPGNPETPETPGNPEIPKIPGEGGNTEVDEKPEQGGNTGDNEELEEGINTDNVKSEDNEGSLLGRLPLTGQESIIGYIGVAALAVGGALFGFKKKKK